MAFITDESTGTSDVGIFNTDTTLTRAIRTAVFTSTATVTLPEAVGSGHTFRIKCRGGTLTIVPTGGDTVNGDTLEALGEQEDLILTDTEGGIWE